MNTESSQLKERIAQLEFHNDQLASEIQYLDMLLRRIGFTHGLESVKVAAAEIAASQPIHERLYEDGLPDVPPGFDD